jgi:poly-gamma-glutamate capsule biosynthesis protein CapA/YwtB (metallophosphatase superfamily)
VKNIVRITVLIALTTIALPSAAQVGISGRVLSEAGEALPGAVVQAGDAAARTGPDGQFTLTVEPAGVHMLRYSAENHFPMIHSYSALDLARKSEMSAGDSVRVPDVSLVQQRENRVMLVFGGDAMMGRRFSSPAPGEPVLIRKGHEAGDTVSLLRHIKPYLEIADFASVNLETQVMASEPEQNAPKSYVFYTPPEALDALKASGVDYVTLGNNHTYDYLAEGLESTIEALDASGLGWSGAGMTESQALKPYRVNIGGTAFSFLGYLGWAGNFTPNQVARGGEKGGAAFGTAENIRSTVHRETGQDYLPVVQYHGSREYTDEPTLVTESRLKQSIDDGAVLAIGHHPHIVQGFEIYKDRLIAYSMGNFMFDQFHYATKRSYLLYVWLDRDRLHRAEVMPLRIKGYLPMPATDTFRETILRRVNELSGRRGIALQASGGNAVILPSGEKRPSSRPPSLFVSAAGGEDKGKILSLQGRAWHEPVEVIETDRDGGVRIRLGKNLLPMGHLESHDLFGATDRSWIADGTQTVVEVENAPSGTRVMQLAVQAGQDSGRIGMRTFEYTFEPGTPSSFVVTARVDKPAVVTAYQQWRKRNENRSEALKTAKLRIIGRQELKPGGWQTLRFDFDSPRVTAISYRVVLRVEPVDSSEDHRSWFDDMALIEWLSPPLDSGPVPPIVRNKLASHVEIAGQ